MTILAKSLEGKEFMYSARSAHKVSKASANLIRDNLNSIRYDLKDGEVWYIHEVDGYDNAYYFAENQGFSVYKGTIRRTRR